MWSRVIRSVAAPTTTESCGAAVWSRAAVFTTSPATMASPRSDLAPSVTTASPVLTPIRTESPQAGPNGTFGVVLVGRGRPEHRHHRIADELLHRAAEPLDLLLQAVVVGAEDGPHVLRVRQLGLGREADEITEE